MKRNLLKALSVTALASLGFMSCVSAESYGEYFKKLTTDGNVDVHVTKDYVNNTGGNYEGGWDQYWLQETAWKIELPEGQSWKVNCAENSDVCKIGIVKGEEVLEEHDVKIVYKETNNAAMEEVKEVIGSFKSTLDNNKSFVLQDLNLINYYANVNGYYETLWAAYSEDMIDLLAGKNVSYKSGLAGQMGDYVFESIFQSYEGYVYHGDEIYALVNGVIVNKRNLLYVPKNTENTREAIAKAAENRIKAYVPNAQVEVTYAGEFVDGKVGGKEAFSNESASVFGNVNEYYNIKIGDKTYKFVILIAKDEVKTPSFDKVDVNSGIKIVSSDKNLPLNTLIKADAIKENTEEFKSISKALNGRDFKAFDISLVSDGVTISKFNGTYTVTIPLGKDYVDKDLTAYYIKDGKIVEDFDVTVDKSGNATFKTTHFSAYAFAETLKDDEAVGSETNKGDNTENPKTGDAIVTYVGLGLVSLGGIGIALKLRKFN